MFTRRPRFPDEWNSIPIRVDDLSLRNTLPVGQTFVWHRHPLPPATHPSLSQLKLPTAIASTSASALTTSPATISETNGIEPIATTDTSSGLDVKPKPDPSPPLIPIVTEPPSNLPLEEYSRAIESPARVLLLRQDEERIWYTSVLSKADTNGVAAGKLAGVSGESGKEELRQRDLTFILDYFQLPHPNPSSSTPSPLPRNLSNFLPLSNQYEKWAQLDPLLFGRAWDRGETPRGVRVLRQEGWECLIAFITSSANNVPRITSLLHKLSQHYSPPLLSLPNPALEYSLPNTPLYPPPDLAEHKLHLAEEVLHVGENETPIEKEGGTTYHLFPGPERLWADEGLEGTLRGLGFGYRAGFIRNTLRVLVEEHGLEAVQEPPGNGVKRENDEDEGDVVERDYLGVRGFLKSLRDVEGDEWKKELIRFKGVGRKVADCVGLMSMDRPNVVPIDTHLQQIAARHPKFPNKLKQKSTSTETVYNQVQEFLTDLWGGNSDNNSEGTGFAGWAQGVMFAADLRGSTAADLGAGPGSASGSSTPNGKKRKAEDGAGEGSQASGGSGSKRGKVNGGGKGKGKGKGLIEFDEDVIGTMDGISSSSSSFPAVAATEKKPSKSSKPSSSLSKSSLPKSLKSSSNGPSTEATKSSSLSSIIQLESDLTSNTSNPNPLIPLLNLARHSDPEVVHKAVWATYRVFRVYIGEEKLKGFGTEDRVGAEGKVKDEKISEKEMVKRWLEERFWEFVDILAGGLRDSETSLRRSACSLLFALLPPLSSSLSTHFSRPSLAHGYLTYILRSLIGSTVSLRGANTLPKSENPAENRIGAIVNDPENKWQPRRESQWPAPRGLEGKLPDDVVRAVVEKFGGYDDLRWAGFKGFTSLVQNLTSTNKHSIPPIMVSNLLAILLPLHNIPKLPADINEFYFPHLSKKPSSTSNKKSKPSSSSSSSLKDTKPNPQSWMDFFDSDSDAGSGSEEGEERYEVVKATGKKRKRKVKVAKDVLSSVWSVESQKKVFGDCWSAVLTLPLSTSETRSILLLLHSNIFPNLAKSKIIHVTDWLGGLCDQGGVLGLLSLDGLFVLMRDYNLEYPHFYRKLYAFMDREVLHVKYRARFFRLTETFLSSPILPASLIASFIKRLSRLSLSAPPASIIMLIPFVYNLLKLHPSCMGMLHRPPTNSAPSKFTSELNPELNTSAEEALDLALGMDEELAETDPFNPHETDPLQTNAIASSLWELKAMQGHYLSHVATMGKLFGEAFTRGEFNLDDFLGYGYGQLFDTEIKRKLKRDPALSILMENQKNVIQGGDVWPALPFDAEEEEEDIEEGNAGKEEGKGERDVVAELWTFGEGV